MAALAHGYDAALSSIAASSPPRPSWRHLSAAGHVQARTVPADDQVVTAQPRRVHSSASIQPTGTQITGTR